MTFTILMLKMQNQMITEDEGKNSTEFSIISLKEL